MSEDFYLEKFDIAANSNQESINKTIKSKQCQAVLACCVAGAKIKDHQRIIDNTETVASFALENSSFEFSNDFDTRQLTTAEIIKNFNDSEWLNNNRNHPIVWMKEALEGFLKLAEAIKTKPPLIKYKINNKTIYLVANGDKLKQAKLLEHAGLNETQIKNLLKI